MREDERKEREKGYYTKDVMGSMIIDIFFGYVVIPILIFCFFCFIINWILSKFIPESASPTVQTIIVIGAIIVPVVHDAIIIFKTIASLFTRKKLIISKKDNICE
ncbi:MAG: hypothetical protein ACLRSB_06010 [Blautia hansenii]